MSESQTQSLIRKIKDYHCTRARIATWWKQRAKDRWLKEGDANSAFFHAIASGRRRSNMIVQVEDLVGELFDDPATVEHAFLEFFDKNDAE